MEPRIFAAYVVLQKVPPSFKLRSSSDEVGGRSVRKKSYKQIFFLYILLDL